MVPIKDILMMDKIKRSGEVESLYPKDEYNIVPGYVYLTKSINEAAGYAHVGALESKKKLNMRCL